MAGAWSHLVARWGSKASCMDRIRPPVHLGTTRANQLWECVSLWSCPHWGLDVQGVSTVPQCQWGCYSYWSCSGVQPRVPPLMYHWGGIRTLGNCSFPVEPSGSLAEQPAVTFPLFPNDKIQSPRFETLLKIFHLCTVSVYCAHCFYLYQFDFKENIFLVKYIPYVFSINLLQISDIS
jgi:hypothetical protein